MSPTLAPVFRRVGRCPWWRWNCARTIVMGNGNGWMWLYQANGSAESAAPGVDRPGGDFYCRFLPAKSRSALSFADFFPISIADFFPPLTSRYVLSYSIVPRGSGTISYAPTAYQYLRTIHLVGKWKWNMECECGVDHGRRCRP
jgi:hypothetical protein